MARESHQEFLNCQECHRVLYYVVLNEDRGEQGSIMVLSVQSRSVWGRGREGPGGVCCPRRVWSGPWYPQTPIASRGMTFLYFISSKYLVLNALQHSIY